MAHYDGRANLIPMNRRSKEEVKELQRRGGTNSGISRRKAKSMAEIIKKMLDAPLKKGTELHRQVVSQLDNLVGEADDPTVEEACILASVKRALKGDTKSLEFLRDTQGEKPKDVVVTEGEVSPVVIAPLNASWVESEQAKQEQAVQALRDAEPVSDPSASANDAVSVPSDVADPPPSVTATPHPKPMFYAPKR